MDEGHPRPRYSNFIPTLYCIRKCPALQSHCGALRHFLYKIKGSCQLFSKFQRAIVSDIQVPKDLSVKNRERTPGHRRETSLYTRSSWTQRTNSGSRRNSTRARTRGCRQYREYKKCLRSR